MTQAHTTRDIQITAYGWFVGPPVGSGPGVPAALSEVIILGGRHCRHHHFQPVAVETQRWAHFRDRALGSPLLQL